MIVLGTSYRKSPNTKLCGVRNRGDLIPRLKRAATASIRPPCAIILEQRNRADIKSIAADYGVGPRRTGTVQGASSVTCNGASGVRRAIEIDEHTLLAELKIASE